MTKINNIIDSKIKNSFGNNYNLVDTYLIGKKRWVIFADISGTFYKRRYDILCKTDLNSLAIINKKQYFINKMKGVLKGWDFSSVLITTGIDDIVVVRDQNNFNYYTRINNVLQNKIPSVKSLLNKEKYLMLEFNRIHGDKYSYNLNDVATLDFKEKIKIICIKHGEFEASIQNHLRGDNCRKCFHEDHPGNYKHSEKIISLYHLELEDINGVFYKIGLSNDINRRIKEIKRKSRKLISRVELLESITGTAKELKAKEKELHDTLRNWNIDYAPESLIGNGRYECYKW